MSTPTSPISEQTALFERRAVIGSPDTRLAQDDPLLDLGSSFILNGLVTPTAVPAAARLIPDEVLRGVGAWLYGSLATTDDDLYLGIDEVLTERSAVATVDAVANAVGMDLGALPDSYADWRLSVEIYVIVGASIYLLAGGLAIRAKVMAEPEVGMLFSRRAFPLLAGDAELTGTAIVLVGIPGRLGAVGGLRGYRRALLDAGRGLEVFRRETTPSSSATERWQWETEFLDDAVAAVLSVDGLERIPLAVGLEVDAERSSDPVQGATE